MYVLFGVCSETKFRPFISSGDVSEMLQYIFVPFKPIVGKGCWNIVVIPKSFAKNQIFFCSIEPFTRFGRELDML